MAFLLSQLVHFSELTLFRSCHSSTNLGEASPLSAFNSSRTCATGTFTVSASCRAQKDLVKDHRTGKMWEAPNSIPVRNDSKLHLRNKIATGIFEASDEEAGALCWIRDHFERGYCGPSVCVLELSLPTTSATPCVVPAQIRCTHSLRFDSLEACCISCSRLGVGTVCLQGRVHEGESMDPWLQMQQHLCFPRFERQNIRLWHFRILYGCAKKKYLCLF